MIREPAHHFVNLVKDPARQQRGTVDQNDGNLQNSRRFQLGLDAAATGILGDDVRDPVGLQQGQIAGQVKGAAGDHRVNIGQREQPFGRIDQPHKVMMLGPDRKGRQVLLADGQENPGGCLGQSRQRACDIGHQPPVIARPGNPRRAFKGAKRYAGGSAGRNRVAADPAGERVGGIDNMGNARVGHIVDQALNPAKTTDPGWHRLRNRGIGATGIGIDRADTRRRKGMGKARRFGGAAQKKDVAHG